MRKIFILKKSVSTHYAPNLKTLIWPATKLPKKSKKVFMKKNKNFSAELGTLLKKYKMQNLFFVKKNIENQTLLFLLKNTLFTYLKSNQKFLKNIPEENPVQNCVFIGMENKYNKHLYFIANKKYSMIQKEQLDLNNNTKTKSLFFNTYLTNKKTRFYANNVSNIYIKNFWFLKNAALVPGIHKIRKPKTFALVQKNSHKILRVWLGKVCFNKICKYLHKTNSVFGFKKQFLFIIAIESLPFVLYQKTFMFKNVFMVLNLYKNKKIYINGFFIKFQLNALKPADVFHMIDLYTITNKYIRIHKNLF